MKTKITENVKPFIAPSLVLSFLILNLWSLVDLASFKIGLTGFEVLIFSGIVILVEIVVTLLILANAEAVIVSFKSLCDTIRLRATVGRYTIQGVIEDVLMLFGSLLGIFLGALCGMSEYNRFGSIPIAVIAGFVMVGIAFAIIFAAMIAWEEIRRIYKTRKNHQAA